MKITGYNLTKNILISNLSNKEVLVLPLDELK